MAQCQSDGSFTAMFAEHEPGALVGRHRITIRVFPTVGPQDLPSFDDRFKASKVVSFQRTIEAGRNNRFEFALTY
jgi:hypothetical protein